MSFWNWFFSLFRAVVCVVCGNTCQPTRQGIWCSFCHHFVDSKGRRV